MITDNVSITGTAASIISINGIFKYMALHDTTPPNSSEPVSPINTFALFKLNIKNPKHVPHTILPSMMISFTSNIIAIIVIVVIITSVTDVANPSTPSVKFIAFVVASITNIVKGMYISNGSVIVVLKNGISISVPSPSMFSRYITNKIDIMSNPAIFAFGFSPSVFLRTTFL